MKHRMYKSQKSGWLLNHKKTVWTLRVSVKKSQNTTTKTKPARAKKLDFYAYDWMGACNSKTVKKRHIPCISAIYVSYIYILLYPSMVKVWLWLWMRWWVIIWSVCVCCNNSAVGHSMAIKTSLFQGNHNRICNFLIKFALLAILFALLVGKKTPIAHEPNEINQHFKVVLYINETCRMPRCNRINCIDRYLDVSNGFLFRFL